MKIYFFFWAFIYFLVDANDENDSIIQTGELKNMEKIAGLFFTNGKKNFEHFLQVVGPVKKAQENIQKFTKAEKNIKYTNIAQTSNCKPSKKCKNGECIRLSDQWQCEGRLIDNACKPTTGCRDTHVCCAPCSKPRGKCKKMGGRCVGGENIYCEGQIISAGCKGGCKCCIAWSYTGKLGPKKWSTVYPNCSGIEQSPINLDLVNITHLTDIIFSNYTDIIKASIIVNDNQLFFGVIYSIYYNLTIQGGGIEDLSHLIGFKFSWGSDSSIGSEHTIKDKRYPMEMQLIHRDYFRNRSDVLCILFEISETDNPALKPIIQAASVLAADKEGPVRYTSIENLQLSSLLPSNTKEFYNYQGSVATPPCTEDIRYTVFTHTSTVSENQLNVLRSIKMGKKSISNNFRPLQPINGRTIFLNK